MHISNSRPLVSEAINRIGLRNGSDDSGTAAGNEAVRSSLAATSAGERQAHDQIRKIRQAIKKKVDEVFEGCVGLGHRAEVS